MNRQFQVGLIGAGTMGKGVARNLALKGFSLSVFDRSAEASAAAVTFGAHAADSIETIARDCNVILTCLPSVESIRTTYFGDHGLLRCAQPGGTLIDLSTGDPIIARQCEDEAVSLGKFFIDAPMLRNPEAAWNGTLHLIVGGDAQVLANVRIVLEAFSERILHVGACGAGQTLKLINNAVTISNTAILCEVFEVARRNGVDLNVLTEALSSSMAASKVLPSVSKRLIDGDHRPLFATDVVRKDISLYSALANETGCVSPIGDKVLELVASASAMGFGQEHYTRIATVLAAAQRRGEVQ